MLPKASELKHILKSADATQFSCPFVLEGCQVEDNQLRLTLAHVLPEDQQALAQSIKGYFKQQHGVDFQVQLHGQIKSHQIRSGLKSHPQIKNIIAVASGKGGVGKSMVSTHLALALKSLGADVGLLDADIYGPSQPIMLGAHDAPTTQDKQSIEPVEVDGLQMMSIGNLVDKDQAIIWRGPMVSKALVQLLRDTRWRQLDYLVVDMPPGTGDIPLTLVKQIPVSGALIVTTPQDLALADAIKAEALFDKVNIPCLGYVENMSAFTCPHCHETSEIFGAQPSGRLALKTPKIVSIPLDIDIRAHADSGQSALNLLDDQPVSGIFKQLAYHVSYQLSMRPRDYSSRMPNVVVE